MIARGEVREVGDGAAAPSPPPTIGRGSGRDAWAEYALALGLEITDDAKRAEIIAAVEAAGKDA